MRFPYYGNFITSLNKNPVSDRMNIGHTAAASRTCCNDARSLSLAFPSCTLSRTPEGYFRVCFGFGTVPIVSIVVPFSGLNNFILRTRKGSPKKELPWRLQVGFWARHPP